MEEKTNKHVIVLTVCVVLAFVLVFFSYNMGIKEGKAKEPTIIEKEILKDKIVYQNKDINDRGLFFIEHLSENKTFDRFGLFCQEPLSNFTVCFAKTVNISEDNTVLGDGSNIYFFFIDERGGGFAEKYAYEGKYLEYQNISVGG